METFMEAFIDAFMGICTLADGAAGMGLAPGDTNELCAGGGPWGPGA